MSKTLYDYRFELIEIINSYSTDSDIDYRYLDNLIINKRVKWLNNVYNRFSKTIPSIYYQTLFCVPLQFVDQSECCSVSIGCQILRTVDKLPIIATLSDGELLEKVSPVSIVNIPDQQFTIIPYRRAEYFGTGKYNTHSVGVFYYNDYLYFISKDLVHFPLLEKVNIRAIFVDPRDAGRFISCDDKPCWSPADIFPLEPKLWEYCKSDIVANDLRIKMSIPEDTRNDNQENNLDDAK